MNSKKAKRLRQLVKHLQEKAAIEQADWSVPGVIRHGPSKLSSSSISSASRPELDQDNPFDGVTYQRVLSADCGKSIYRAMKKRALTSIKAK